VAFDIYVAGYEPDPPANVQARVAEAGILVTWQPSSAIPGAFDPMGSPPLGYYDILIRGQEAGRVYGWAQRDRPLSEASYLVPFHRQDFGPGDLGLALEEMDDGVYYLDLSAVSESPKGTAGQGTECEVIDYSGEELRLVIEGGQVRVEAPSRGK
jgi:hypothetical protein